MEPVTMAKAINLSLHDALEGDEQVLVFGEDVGTLGGVFRITDGLQKTFGADRVFDTPLAESAIIGIAVGLALRGFRPVPEIQFDGFIYPAFDQIVSHVAKYRNRSGISMPITIRIPFGGHIGAVEHHSESPEAYFTHTAGLKVVAPATPGDAYGLLRSAIADPDPVIFFEPGARGADRQRPGGTRRIGCNDHRLRADRQPGAGCGRGCRKGEHLARGHRPAQPLAPRHADHPDVAAEDASRGGGSRSAGLRRV